MPTAVATSRKRPTDEQILDFYHDEKHYHQRLRDDPVLWARLCGFNPHPGQLRILRCDPPMDRPGQSTVIPFARQLGKTTSIAIWGTHRCFSVPGFTMLLLAPSGRQSSELFNRCVSILDNSEYVQTYVNYQVKHERITFPDFNSEIRILRTGLHGDHARSASTGAKGNRGVCVYEETASFAYLNTVLSATNPISMVEGATIYIGSPGWKGSAWHDLYLYHKSEQERAIKEGREPKYQVIESHWSETDHISPAWIAAKRAEHEALGTLPEFLREYEGEWTSPSNRFFPDDLIDGATVDHVRPIRKGDQIVGGLDIAGLHTPTVISLCRFDPGENRLELCQVLSLVFEDNRYVDKSQHTVIKEYRDIIDIALGLRQQYGSFLWWGWDNGNERRIGQELESHNFPMEAISGQTYQAKMSLLHDLSKALVERRLVLAPDSGHMAIRQLRNFAPPLNPATGKYEFERSGKNYDIICTLAQCVRFLGTRRQPIYAFHRGAKCDW